MSMQNRIHNLSKYKIRHLIILFQEYYERKSDLCTGALMCARDR